MRPILGQESRRAHGRGGDAPLARLEPAKRALYDGVRSLTYGALEAQSTALARSLVGAGVRRGEVVSAYLPNCIDYVVVVLAVAKSGAIFSPINPRYKGLRGRRDPEAGARPRVVFTMSGMASTIEQAVESVGQQPVVVPDRSRPSAGGGRVRAARSRGKRFLQPHVHLGHHRRAQGERWPRTAPAWCGC
jgi:acyl-CoA synthetase (AMP-forming)/AMP-acid ligase II